MASALQKLLSKSPSARIITALQHPTGPNPTPTLLFHQPHLIEFKQDHDSTRNFFPLLDSRKAENLTNLQSSFFYPSFPFGFCLNPIPSTRSIQSESNDNVSGDSGGLWADSVKKKRKKKMNKHKYRKLRKRLGRKT